MTTQTEDTNMADETTVYASIRDLIAQYWDIAYAEGASGASRGDDANAVLHKIDIELDRLRTELASARADAEREFLEQWLQFAATPIGQECCGFGRDEECCGDPSPVYNSADQVLSAMGARHHEITAAIAQVQPMIPDPLAKLREMAPEWAEWFVVENSGGVWWQMCVEWHEWRWHHYPPNKAERDLQTIRRDNPFALNLKTGMAKFPDGTSIPEAVWMRYYRARAGGV